MNAYQFGFGFLVFSLVATLIFSFGSSLGAQYGSPDQATITELGGKYNIVSNYSTEQNSSVVRTMGLQMDNSNPTSADLTTFFLRGGIEAGKTLAGLITTPIALATYTQNSLSQYVPKLFLDFLKGILLIGIVMIVLVMFMRVKPET